MREQLLNPERCTKSQKQLTDPMLNYITVIWSPGRGIQEMIQGTYTINSWWWCYNCYKLHVHVIIIDV